MKKTIFEEIENDLLAQTANDLQNDNQRVVIGNVVEDLLKEYLKLGFFPKRIDPYLLFPKIGEDAESGSKFMNNLKSVAILTDSSCVNNDFEQLGCATPVNLIQKKLNESKIKTTDNNGDTSEYQIDSAFLHSHQEAIPINFGTCFFIEEDKVAMAYHSLKEINRYYENAKETQLVIIRGYYYESKGNLRQIKGSDLYVLDKVIKEFDAPNKQDWAICSVKPRFANCSTQKEVVNINDSTLAVCGMDTYCLGHGWNLPMKISLHGTVFKPACDQANSDTFFSCKLETYPGNSGSPVFNSTTHQFVGIVSGGDSDYYPINGKIIPFARLGGESGAHCTHARHLSNNNNNRTNKVTKTTTSTLWNWIRRFILRKK